MSSSNNSSKAKGGCGTILFAIILLAIMGSCLSNKSGNTGTATQTSKQNLVAVQTSKQNATTTIQTTAEETLSREDQKEFIKNAVITLEDSHMKGPDSAGGLSFDIDIKNRSESEIKYIYIEVVVLNAVGDILRSDTDFDESPAVTLTMTGPIAPGEVGGLGRTWKCAFYTTTANSWGINQVAIEYMSGLTVILNREDCILLQEIYAEDHS